MRNHKKLLYEEVLMSHDVELNSTLNSKTVSHGNRSGVSDREMAPTESVSFFLREKASMIIGALLFVITVGHYIAPEGHHILHNILQRLYYIPIIWAAYSYGMRGGLLVSILSGLLYLPHIILAWQSHPVYQVTQIIEIILFPVAGVATGFLFEQKLQKQRQLQSYEKMALFGTLSRSIIRSLKRPLKSLRGMLIAVEPMAQRDQGLNSLLDVMRQEVETIEKVRGELISLVERKRLRLKKHSLTTTLFEFASQMEIHLKLRNVKINKSVKDLKLMAHLNHKAINEILQQLVETMLQNTNGVSEITLYADQSSTFVWLGATSDNIQLDSYFQSDLATRQSDYPHDYELISVINVMNNHFGDVRVRKEEAGVIEFLLVFPKKLNLPWHLKDAASATSPQSQPAK